MLRKKLTDEEMKIVEEIIDSTNEEYINQVLDKYVKYNIPRYEKKKGLPIGNLTSQFLSIYYLNKLDHFIVHDLHLKYYVRYMDDFVILHEDKQYLKQCLKIIIEKLEKEYLLQVNENKTKIINAQEGFIFLGYKFILKNKKTIMI